MILDGKKVMEILSEFEKDLMEQHLVDILDKKESSITTITAAKIFTIREIRDRLGVSEIKA